MLPVLLTIAAAANLHAVDPAADMPGGGVGDQPAGAEIDAVAAAADRAAVGHRNRRAVYLDAVQRAGDASGRSVADAADGGNRELDAGIAGAVDRAAVGHIATGAVDQHAAAGEAAVTIDRAGLGVDDAAAGVQPHRPVERLDQAGVVEVAGRTADVGPVIGTADRSDMAPGRSLNTVPPSNSSAPANEPLITPPGRLAISL